MIRFEKVYKRFGGKIVLNGVDLEVDRGETLVIVGLSGSGKSVMLKHMVRLLEADQGTVRIDGESVETLNRKQIIALRSRFGMLFQGAALLQWMSVFDNVALPLRERTDRSKAEIDKLVRGKLELVGLLDAADRMPTELSGGMQKRVGLARAIVMNPEILLYDEPTSGLDPVTSRRIERLIADTGHRMGATSVVVTHDVYFAFTFATRIAMLHEGCIVQHAKPQAFMESTVPAVQQFLQSQYITERNRWEVEVNDGTG